MSTPTLPSEANAERALAMFRDAVVAVYGPRVHSIALFGSRARGSHTPESDVDVAVVLADDGWTFWDEKIRLTDLGYEPMVETGAYLQAWPFGAGSWAGDADPQSLVGTARRDARTVWSRP